MQPEVDDKVKTASGFNAGLQSGSSFGEQVKAIKSSKDAQLKG
jgi:hypothetical protein